MTEEEVYYVRKCIQEKDMHRFYNWSKWKRVRLDVLRLDNYECQMCKQRGRYKKASTVHHINYVVNHPELALEIYYLWQGTRKRNLLSLCHDCHEEVHGYRKNNIKEPLTEERWE